MPGGGKKRKFRWKEREQAQGTGAIPRSEPELKLQAGLND